MSWQDDSWRSIDPAYTQRTRAELAATELAGAAKASSGVWTAWAGTDAPLSSLSRSPNKLMAEAEALFHNAPWVGLAERIVSGRMGRVKYHLEAEDGETLNRKMGPKVASLLDALDIPSPGKTRRQLWSLTGRHEGLTGNAFWYLDQRELLAGTPLQTLYINPARMTPAEDGNGNLIGWIMDHAQNPMTSLGSQAVPFILDEIIHFPLDEPDSGHWGIGIPESAQIKVELSRLADRHTGQVLASGGRLAGIISPKAGETIGDDAWAAMVRDYRNIVGDPDSAKKLQIVKGPVDFTQTVAGPKELELNALLTMGRDDTFALWGVPLSQAGIVSSRGLNSGETPKYEEAALWQGPIEERLFGFREKVQREFVDRWQELGVAATLVLETPTFDDQAPMFVNAEKAKIVPLTNNERRSIVGLDPLVDETLGEAVYLDQSMVPINGVPEPVVAPPVAPQPIIEEGLAKASALETLRSRTEVTWEPRIRKVVQQLLKEQRDSIAARVEAKHAHLSKKPGDVRMWWDEGREVRRWKQALLPLVEKMADEVSNRAARRVPAKADPVPFLDRVLALVRDGIGLRITSISETTRDDVSRLVEQGVEAGLSPGELGQSIREATAFNEARSELISRTETMNAYNEAALGTYRELEVKEVTALDGDKDEECASRDGRTYPIDEAYGIQDHPNGTLDWVPVYAKAAPVQSMTLPAITLNMPEQPEFPTPVVNVAAAAAPEVIVNMDTSQFAKALADIQDAITRPKTLIRNEQGRIIGVE